MTFSEKENVLVSIHGAIGSEICVSQRDGERLFKIIYSHFQRNQSVTLSFKGVKYIISAFLNPALGMLYKYFDSDYLNANMKIKDVTSSQLTMIKEVLRNAKEFYENEIKASLSLQESIDDQL